MTKNPIIALWCHPRSMSTAMERVMRERGDCQCFHEPFMYDYYLHRKVRVMPHFEPQGDRPVKYQAIRNELVQSSDNAPVFFKDMSYYMVPQLFADPDFALSIRNIFLIRDPRLSIASYAKLDAQLSLEEVGVEAIWHHVNWLREQSGSTPVILQAEAVQHDPKAGVARLFQAAGLDSVDGVLDFSGDTPMQWGDVSGWHNDVINSDGIRKIVTPINSDEVFQRAVEQRHELQAFLEHHMPFYDDLKNLASL
jgi:hypothetical protein